MKLTILIYLFAITFLFGSCFGKTEQEAREDCYQNQIGVYEFDTTKTKDWKILSFEKNVVIEDLILIFHSDSTFTANIKVPFLDDTFGNWDAGTCGFESMGELSFKNSPHKIQFAPYENDTLEFCLIGINRNKRGEEYIWFKRNSILSNQLKDSPATFSTPTQ